MAAHTRRSHSRQSMSYIRHLSIEEFNCVITTAAHLEIGQSIDVFERRQFVVSHIQPAETGCQLGRQVRWQGSTERIVVDDKFDETAEARAGGGKSWQISQTVVAEVELNEAVKSWQKVVGWGHELESWQIYKITMRNNNTRNIFTGRASLFIYYRQFMQVKGDVANRPIIYWPRLL